MLPARRRRRTGRGGFTLLEAITVLVIIGILSSFAIVIYSGYRRSMRTKTSARQVETLLRTARSMAINQNAHFQAVLDLATSGIWIDQIDTNGQVIVPKVTTPEVFSSYVRVTRVSINGILTTHGLARIQFHPNGTSDSARIVLLAEGGQDRPGDTYTVQVYSPTARSRIFAEARF